MVSMIPLSPKNFSAASSQSLAIAVTGNSAMSGNWARYLAWICGLMERYPYFAMTSCAGSVNR